MICYVIGEKTSENRIERNADCLEYIDYLLNLSKEVIILKKEGFKHFTLCSDSEFTNDFKGAVLHFYGSDATIEEGHLPRDNAYDKNDVIIKICDGLISREAV